LQLMKPGAPLPAGGTIHIFFGNLLLKSTAWL
jgi:hypothetical protein